MARARSTSCWWTASEPGPTPCTAPGADGGVAVRDRSATAAASRRLTGGLGLSPDALQRLNRWFVALGARSPVDAPMRLRFTMRSSSEWYGGRRVIA